MADGNYLRGSERRVLGEPYHMIDGALLCASLARAYPGLGFRQVGVRVQSDGDLRSFPDRELVTVSFDVSGADADLLRYRFADAAWLSGLRVRGSRADVRTEGLGSADRVSRNATGYRVHGGSYVDGLDRLAALFVPAMLETTRKRKQ